MNTEVQAAPVLKDGIRYEVFEDAIPRGFVQRLGVVRAVDTRSDEELWSRAVWPAPLLPAKRTDGGPRAVEVAIVSLSIEGGMLVVENEAGWIYEMDLDGRSSRLRQPERDTQREHGTHSRPRG